MKNIFSKLAIWFCVLFLLFASICTSKTLNYTEKIKSYEDVVFEEEHELYCKFVECEVAKFKSACVDKCVNLPEKFKIEALKTYEKTLREKVSVHDFENLMQNDNFRYASTYVDRFMKSDKYDKFLFHAEKFTCFKTYMENNKRILEFSGETIIWQFELNFKN